MNLVQRYVFRKLLGALLISFPALAAATVWATQALGRLSLVTDRGQGLGVFFEATILLLPGLVPAALLASARSPRQRRGLRTAGTILSSGLLLGFNLHAGGGLERSPRLLYLIYAVPVAGIFPPILFMASHAAIRFPRWPRRPAPTSSPEAA